MLSIRRDGKIKYVFTGGGTLGHTNPAIAVAEMIKKRDKDAKIVFMMREGGKENEAVIKHGFEVRCFSSMGFDKHKIISFCAITLRSVLQTRGFLGEYKPDVVFGTGGYVSFAPCISGLMLGIPTFIHESNIVPGLVTRVLSRLGAFVLLGNEESTEHLGKNAKVATVGTPLLSEFDISRESARRKMKLTPSDILIVSFGGSGGARRINEIMLEVMQRHSINESTVKHIHATGRSYLASYEKKIEEMNLCCSGCEVVPYIENMPEMLSAADIVVCRAGAMTLCEIARCGCAAILIPSPNVASDHQRRNADRLEKCSAAIVIDENDLTAEKMIDKLSMLEKSRAKRQSLSEHISKTVKTDAKSRICDFLQNKHL